MWRGGGEAEEGERRRGRKGYTNQVTLIIDQTIDTIVTSSSPLAVSKAISAS